MPGLRINSIWIVLFLSFEFASAQNTTVFIGKVYTDRKNKAAISNGGLIEFKTDTLVTAKEFVREGCFLISATTDRALDIFYLETGAPDMYIQTVQPTIKDTVSLNFTISRRYKKRMGRAVCPKCNRHDQTIPIHYGMKTITVYNNPPPYTTYDGFGRKEIYDGGCNSHSSPKYRCKRDKINF